MYAMVVGPKRLSTAIFWEGEIPVMGDEWEMREKFSSVRIFLKE
jgi:hypothetical protein